MQTPEVADALRQSTITHQLSAIRRRHEELQLQDGISDDEVSRQLLMLQDRLAGHLRSRSRALVRDDAEALGAVALQLLLQTQP